MSNNFNFRSILIMEYSNQGVLRVILIHPEHCPMIFDSPKIRISLSPSSFVIVIKSSSSPRHTCEPSHPTRLGCAHSPLRVLPLLPSAHVVPARHYRAGRPHTPLAGWPRSHLTIMATHTLLCWLALPSSHQSCRTAV